MNYYNTLGIDKSASQDDIKRAYRKLASQHHPDKGGDVKRFQEIEEAYRTLSDPDKRAQYDNPPQQNFNFGGMPPSFEDIFAHAFGGNHPFADMFGRRNQPQRNRNLNMGIEISLEDAYAGKELLANVRLPSGKEQVIEVKIPPGIRDNTTMRLSGLGDDSNHQAPRGDLHITVHVLPHSFFARDNDDLIKELEVSCIDAMIGKKIMVDTIDSKTLEVNIAPGTQPNQLLSLYGYGMPNMHDNRMKGRLLLKVKITIPTFLTDEQKQALETLFK